METSEDTSDGVPDLPPLHPAFTLMTALAVGLAALAVPWWLGHANPTGLEMVDGVVVYSPEASGAKVRGHGYVGDYVLAPPPDPKSRRLAVGVTHLCVEDDHSVELTGLRVISEGDLPAPDALAMVRRVPEGSVGPDGYRLAFGTDWASLPSPGEESPEADIVGTWHALEGSAVTGPCIDGEPDIFLAGGEEVVVAIDVGARGIEVDRFEIDALVEGRPHRFVVDADLAVCGSRVDDEMCDEMD